MSAIVKPVVDDDMLLQELATSANSIVSRRRVLVGSTTQGPFSHRDNPYSTTSKIQFDILEAESFLDLRSLLLQAIMIPQFYKSVTTAPTSAVTAGSGAVVNGYMKGSSPELDRTIDSLLYTLRIGNSQGLIIEAHDNYGTWCQILNNANGMYDDSSKPLKECAENIPQNLQGSDIGGDSFSAYRFDNAANQLSSGSIDDQLSSLPTSVASPTGSNASPVAQRNVILPFTGSSFLNRIKLLPMFLLRAGLRIEIEFENPHLAFFNNCGWDYVGSISLLTDNVPSTFAPSIPLKVGDMVVITYTDPTALPTAITPALNPCGIPIFSAQVIAANAAGTATAFNTMFGTSGANTRLFLGGTNILTNPTQTTILNYYGYVLRPRGEGNCVIASAVQSGVHPFNILSQDSVVEGTTLGTWWSYGIQQPQLICDFIKPSAEIYQEYLNRFQTPQGLSHAYDRIQYQSFTLPQTIGPGVQSIPLTFSCRSLKGLVIVLQDPITDATIRSSFLQMNFPCKSSFMLRGCTGVNVQIGAQQFPAYTLKVPTESANNLLVEEGLLLGSFSQSMGKFASSRLGTDYARMQGVLGQAAIAAGGSNPFTTIVNYKDTRSAVIGISTMKKDNGFLQGVDTTQSGNMILNLTFSSNIPIHPTFFSGSATLVQRAISVRVWAISDAVFSIQKDSNAVRY